MAPEPARASPAGPERRLLFGVPIDDLTLQETVAEVERFVRLREPRQHVVVNVDKIVKIQKDARLREAVLGCDLINADGQPVVWASRLLGRPLKERVTGIDLFHELVGLCARKGFRPYFLGAKQEIVDLAVARLKLEHPGLNVAGARNGYWSSEEERGVAEGVRDSGPDILFVAMGSPAKEIFVSRWKTLMRVPFTMGVGGTFDIVAGKVSRAPAWMRGCGLEWFHRLCQEPRRMWRRYLIEDIAFLPLLLREVWSLRRRGGE